MTGYRAKVSSTTVRTRLRVPGRRHTADDLVGGVSHQLRIGLADRRGCQHAGQQLGVDAVRAAGHHQQRLAVAVEHQAVGDRADLAPELGSGGNSGLGIGVEDSDVRFDACGGHRSRHPGISFVHVS